MDAIAMLSKDDTANSIAYKGKTVSIGLTAKLQAMIPATPKAKNGNKKTSR
jgi:hypothetical protein